MVGLGREDKKDNDLFYTCSLIDYISRKTKNIRADVVNQLGRKRLEKIYDLADVYHCDNIDQVSEDFIAEAHIPIGTFDNVKECKYSIPSHWDIGKVYKRLIKQVAASEKIEIVDALIKVYNSFTSMEEKVVKILNEMSEYLSIAQMKKLQEVMLKVCAENEADKVEIPNKDFLEMFLDAKKIEGCSERTLQYYRVTVEHLLSQMGNSVRKVTTEEIRTYLADYQKNSNCSNVTIDNIRRNISSFFSWLEEEDYILKSPMRRIHKIKTKTVVKNTISDESIEKLRDYCTEIRDLAIIDLLYSTGIRVGELVNLNIDDIDLEGRECIVYGKGDKERRVYFDAKAKVHLKEYIEGRKDENKALFVTLDAPYDRLKISGVEIRLRQLGRKLDLEKIHPHKFRRTMATRAIDKGMPIEQVQKILGHSQIDTTMQYAMVNQNNVKTSHQKYMS